jgi:hypothetical protein
MRKRGDMYEYVALHVDDLAIAMIDPEELINILRDRFHVKLKGVGPMKFHFGCDFCRDLNNTPCSGLKNILRND